MTIFDTHKIINSVLQNIVCQEQQRQEASVRSPTAPKPRREGSSTPPVTLPITPHALTAPTHWTPPLMNRSPWSSTTLKWGLMHGMQLLAYMGEWNFFFIVLFINLRALEESKGYPSFSLMKSNFGVVLDLSKLYTWSVCGCTRLFYVRLLPPVIHPSSIILSYFKLFTNGVLDNKPDIYIPSVLYINSDGVQLLVTRRTSKHTLVFWTKARKKYTLISSRNIIRVGLCDLLNTARI